ncbi:MAG TPA: arginine deiminase-related protein [Ferruginibacter sp.]|nr:arginine deiminase-related protein [Ferruginibacter sp.]
MQNPIDMQQCRQLLMIRPVNFGYNAETAVNNAFQTDTGQVQEAALREFDNFVTLLRRHQVNVLVIEDSPEPFTPDSIFPNNWISFQEHARIFLYPMFAPNRRKERKPAVLETIKNRFRVDEIVDLSRYETEGYFLEGTGSLVLDRENKIAFACRSPRTSEKVLNEFCRLSGYTACCFHATDQRGMPIYHTNVMMCVADRYAVICPDSIADIAERENLLAQIRLTNKEVIPITQDQLDHFAGNMLQVMNAEGQSLLIMSSQAYHSLNAEQAARLENHNPIIHAPLETIESAGGSSARCMLAEVFLAPV